LNYGAEICIVFIRVEAPSLIYCRLIPVLF
jgi:hypothetical protein